MLLVVIGGSLLLNSRSAYQSRVATCLLAVSILSGAIALLEQPSFTVGRRVVVVSNHDLAQNEIVAISELIAPDTPTRILRVASQGEENRTGPFLPWRDLSRNTGRSTRVVRLSEQSWLANALDQALNELLGKGESWFSLEGMQRFVSMRTLTLVFAFKSNGAFGSAPPEGEFAKARDRLVQSRVELISLNTNTRPRNVLKVILQRRLFPVAPMRDITDYFLLDAPDEVTQFLRGRNARLYVGIDQDPGATAPRVVSSWTFPMRVRLVPSEGVGERILAGGFHKLAVRVVVDEGTKPPTWFGNSTYFEARDIRVEIVSADSNSTRSALSARLASLRPGRINWMNSSDWIVRPESTFDSLAGDVSPRSIIIDRPQRATLDKLDDPRFVQRIMDGINLSIFEPAPGVHAVLPAGAREYKNRPVSVHYDRRLYFLVDNSVLSHLMNSSGLEIQRNVINHLLEQLKSTVRVMVGGVSLTGITEPLCLDDNGGRASPCRYSDLRVFPPIALTGANEKSTRDLYATTSSAAWSQALRLELAPASETALLAQLFDESKDILLRESDIYPNATVVVFARKPAGSIPLDAMPFQRCIGQAAAQNCGPAILGLKTAKDLTTRGIKVVIIWLPTPEGFNYYDLASGADGVGLPALQRELSGESPGSLAPGLREAALLEINDADKAPQPGLVQAVRDWLPFEFHIQATDRTFDPRLPLTAKPPMSTLLLAAQEGDTLADVRSPTSSFPAIVGRRLGEGYVQVSSYSPLTLDALRNEAGENGAFGVQRLIDTHFISGGFAPSPANATLSAIEELPDETTLHFQCWFPATATGVPTVELNGKTLPISTLDIGAGVATFQYRSTEAISATSWPLIVRYGGQLVEKQQVFLSLKGADYTGRTTIEMLSGLGAISGGGEFDLGGDVTGVLHRLQAFKSGLWALSMMIGTILLVLFSPTMRPWMGVRYWWLWIKGAVSGQSPGLTGLPRLDVRGMLSSWGQSPGRPASTRIAGAPGPTKLYEPGDALFLARRRSLVPFTAVGKRLRLPPAKPTMKQKEFNRSMRVYICFDTSQSIRFPNLPSAKLETAVSLTFFAARVVLLRGGQVLLGDAPTYSSTVDLGPAITEDEIVSLTKQFLSSNTLPAYSTSITPREAVSGDVIIFITDLLGTIWDRIDPIVDAALNDGVDLRIIQVIDPSEFRTVGGVWNVTRGGFFDRTAWSEADVRELYTHRTNNARDALRRCGGRFAVIFSNQTPAEMIEALNGVLD